MNVWLKYLLKTIGFFMITLLITVIFAGIWQFAALPQEVAVAQLGPGIAAVLFVFVFRDKDINRKEFPNDLEKPKGWHFIVLTGQFC